MRTRNAPETERDTSKTVETFDTLPSLIASDVDGTLISSEGRITPRTHE